MPRKVDDLVGLADGTPRSAGAAEVCHPLPHDAVSACRNETDFGTSGGGTLEVSAIIGGRPLANEVRLWVKPLPLEGVKSSKRQIFGVESAEVLVGGEVNRISSVRVTLESRILAVGEVGRAMAELLLGERDFVSGKAIRHARLVVVHVGPHLAGVAGATVKQHRAALAAAMQVRPQVVILDDGLVVGDEAWTQTFNEIVQSGDISRFCGGVVFCVAEELPVVCQLCSERWARDFGWLMQAQLTGGVAEILEDILGSGKSAEACTDELLEAVRELSEQCFSEDAIGKCQDADKEYRWVMSVLTEVRPDSSRAFRGFICHQHFTPIAEVHIARLAIVPGCRNGGHGQRLMHWILEKAKQMPQSECSWITLSALDTAIPFYEKFGFTDMTTGDPADPDHFQTWMELRNISTID